MSKNAIPFANLQIIARNKAGRVPMLRRVGGMPYFPTRELLRWMVAHGEKAYGVHWWAEAWR